MTAKLWWQKAVVYQIYPRSFQDSDGDGVGDLRGIIARLDYLADLGIDAVWLSPIFPSPMADFGYDIADYVGIDPLFGSLEDFDDLIGEAHGRGLRVILDFVPNHTSDRHAWFAESRSSRDNPRRDWYIWRDPAPDGGPPNNWLSEFGGSAWEHDPLTGQYFYHAFLASQPDLNWRNPQVQEAMHDVLRFWFRRGVDGFRVDALWHLLKDDRFRDNPPNPDYEETQAPYRRLQPVYTTDLPEIHETIRGIRSIADEFPDRLLIGELYLPIERLMAYYGRDLSGMHLPFNFALLNTAWEAKNLAQLIGEYEAALPTGGWPNWVLGNHDRPRIASRIGRGQARVAAMLLLSLRGTLTVYYGEEIGMLQVAIPQEFVRDPFERNVPGLGLGRDGARTPMQWDAAPGAGFSDATPWLPLGPDAASENVANQKAQGTSMLNLYRRLLRQRRETSALSSGPYELITAIENVLLLVRRSSDEIVLVALNLSELPAALRFADASLEGKVRVSTVGDREGEEVGNCIDLRGDEGLIVQLDPDCVLPPVLSEPLAA